VAPGSLSGLAGAWWAVLAVVALTLGLSVAVALLLARVTDLDRVTAGIGMLPGAAPALISVGDEVGADARLVATMQYARVLLVVASVPALMLLLGSGLSAQPGGGVGAEPSVGPEPVLVAVVVGLVGAGLAALAHSPAASLVGPLLLSAVAGATGLLPVAVPSIAADMAFAIVGASVGLRFDRESLRHAGRLAPYMAGAVLALTAGSAALGLVLLAALDTDALTAYLATTPGGISSVLAATFDSGADVTIVVAVQTLRLMLLALISPFAARLLRVPVPA
jgi:membrane AbrB-like protein